MDPGDDDDDVDKGPSRRSPASSVERSRQSDWARFFGSKSVGAAAALRFVKKEQARWEKWGGVRGRGPLVKRDTRRGQEKGGVWVDAGTVVGMVDG